jgi:uncharacterized metal-binding protein
MKKSSKVSCARCEVPADERACMTAGGKGGKGCPTKGKKGLIKTALSEYREEGLREFARQASIQEGECFADRDKIPYVKHAVKPRMLEIIEFAKKMGYRRLGLVFCAGLKNEGAVVGGILENHGFEVVSVLCKVGGVPKEELGLKDSEKIHRGMHESMCNPVLQAMIVNEAGTEFNILLGLCVGHDSMYFRYAEAPTTVLAVKDRVAGHNPLACIATSGTYYSWINEP